MYVIRFELYQPLWPRYARWSPSLLAVRACTPTFSIDVDLPHKSHE